MIPVHHQRGQALSPTKELFESERFIRMVAQLLPEIHVETVRMTTLTNEPPTTSAAQEQALAKLIVQTLNLTVDATTIDPTAPLYGEGLGLDSIDMLEIALAVSQTYGVKLRADDKNNNEIFSSLAHLNRYIQQQR